MNIPITIPRFEGAEADHRLAGFIFAGHYAPPRVPRGIRPELVSTFIQTRIVPDSPAPAYSKTGEVLRFYERTDVVPHLMLALNGRERSLADVQRSAYVVQTVGDLGTPEQIAQAVGYFDRVLVPHRESMGAIGSLEEALIALAPAGSSKALSERLAEEVERASHVANLRGPDGLRHRMLTDIQSNELPGTLFVIEGKNETLALPPVERRAELVAVYLDQSDLKDPQLQVWAARLLRHEAMTGDAGTVQAEFSKALDGDADKASKGDKDAGFVVVRAAQAILYLQGKLTAAQQKALDQSQGGAMNFLSDDL